MNDETTRTPARSQGSFLVSDWPAYMQLAFELLLMHDILSFSVSVCGSLKKRVKLESDISAITVVVVAVLIHLNKVHQIRKTQVNKQEKCQFLT